MKKMMVLCLLLLTTVGLGKVGLSLVSKQEVGVVNDVVVAQTNPIQFMPMAEEPLHEQRQKTSTPSWRGQWLVGELIPSAEAAKAMSLDEEKRMEGNKGEIIVELQKQQKRLDARERQLDEREAVAKDAESRAAKKISALEALQKRIQAQLDQEDSIKDKKIKRLTSVYEGMNAEKAAPVIAQMDLEIVVKIFSRMGEKQVGKILSFLPPQKAVVISQALTKRIASVSK